MLSKKDKIKLSGTEIYTDKADDRRLLWSS